MHPPINRLELHFRPSSDPFSNSVSALKGVMEAVELIKLSHRVATRKQELLSIPFCNAANLFVKFGWLQGDRKTPASGLGENKTGAGGQKRSGYPRLFMAGV